MHAVNGVDAPAWMAPIDHMSPRAEALREAITRPSICNPQAPTWIAHGTADDA
jgi:hypothetical protein